MKEQKVHTYHGANSQDNNTFEEVEIKREH